MNDLWGFFLGKLSEALLFILQCQRRAVITAGGLLIVGYGV